jgi:hypothetical protein
MLEQILTGAVVYRRSGTDFQREVYASPEAIIDLPEIGVRLPLASVYEEVPFVAESEESQLE